MVEDRDIIQDNESLMLELIDTRKSLTNSEAQRIKYVELMKEYERRIVQLESENEELERRWNSQFDDQRARIDSVVEIAKKERGNFYDNIINLIDNRK